MKEREKEKERVSEKENGSLFIENGIKISIKNLLLIFVNNLLFNIVTLKIIINL